MVGTNWWHVFALAKMAAEVHRILRQTRAVRGIPTDVDLETVNGVVPRLRRELESL